MDYYGFYCWFIMSSDKCDEQVPYITVEKNDTASCCAFISD